MLIELYQIDKLRNGIGSALKRIKAITSARNKILSVVNAKRDNINFGKMWFISLKGLYDLVAIIKIYLLFSSLERASKIELVSTIQVELCLHQRTEKSLFSK